VEVRTTYVDLPATAIEQAITNRLESRLNQAHGKARVESRSLHGLSIVRVYFPSDRDRSEALKMVHAVTVEALPNLPPGTLPPITLPVDPANAAPAGYLVVFEPTLTEANLKDLARREIRPRLIASPGVVAPVVLGGKDRVLLVWLDPSRLAARKVSVLNVVKALEAAKLEPRRLHLEDGLPRIQLDAGPEQLETLDALPLGKVEGTGVWLRDVAKSEVGFAPQSELVRIDGRRTVCVPVYCQTGTSAAAVHDAVRKALPQIENKLPRGTRLSWVLERPADARQLTLFLRAPAGASLAETEKRVAAIERFLERTIPANERTVICSEVGLNPGRLLGQGWNTGPQDATVRVQLSERSGMGAAEQVVKLRHQFQQEKDFADLVAWFQAGAAEKPPVTVRVEGKDLEKLTRIALALRKQAAAVTGAADVLVAQNQEVPGLEIAVDRQKAADVGLTAGDVLLQAAAALGGEGASLRGLKQQLEGGRTTLLVVSRPGVKLEAVQGAPIMVAIGKTPVKLGDLVTLRRKLLPNEITHVKLARVVSVWVNVENRSAQEVARAVEEKLKDAEVPEGVRVTVTGEK
jgi:multidrug efflux pump subunit AcrB